LDRAKIYALDADVTSFLTYLCQIDNNDVDGFLLYTATIKCRYAQRRALIKGIVASGIPVDVTPLSPTLGPAHDQTAQDDEPAATHQVPDEIRRDCNVTPISARGYPHTPWYLQSLAQQALNDSSTQPQDEDNGDHDDGGRDPNGGGYDDPDEDDESPSQRTHHQGNHRFTNHYEPPDPGSQALENSNHCRQHSTLLYYTADPKRLMANQVKWLVKSIDGPYAGKHERLAKCSFKLADDSAGAFFVFYNSLKSFLGSNGGFSPELLPALQHISKTLDLTLTPIHVDMPRVSAYGGGEKKPMIDWIEAHSEFSSTLYALFASQGVIAVSTTRS
jgi:hypothetical protein